MKFKYDLEYVSEITGIEKDRIESLLEYFSGLPLMAKLEVFYISKLIEEEDECAFLQHHFDTQKIGEYGFSLFLLAILRLFNLENKDTSGFSNLSSYKLKQISSLKALRNTGDNSENKDITN